MRCLVICLALLVGPAFADPGPQLVRSVELGLARHHLAADVGRFDTATVAALHLTLSGNEGPRETLRKLKAILADPGLRENEG